jgi:hypothetical protein
MISRGEFMASDGLGDAIVASFGASFDASAAAAEAQAYVADEAPAPAFAEPAPTPAAAGMWQCFNCTFAENAASEARCAVCDALRQGQGQW